ncbi:MAG: hypothetical protein IKU01_00820 [Bacteroidales bacterium]|nr:hypothetical protein [Bacteroidales bacterium]
MWMVITAIITGLCYASLLYLFNKSQHYGKTLATILFILRTAAVGILIMLFFNPYIKKKNTKIEPATIIIAQDNSNSLTLTKDSIFYKEKYPLILDTLINDLEENYIVDKYLFGNEVKEFTVIDYKDYYTDFHEVLNDIKKKYYKKNVGAVVLLSDGICNKSYLPEQNVESYPFPIYTVTLGDTVSYPDFYIKDVFYNKTTPSNTTFPLRITANANNCRNKQMKIKILVNNDIVEETDIQVNSNRFSRTLDFNINSENEGIKQIDVKIETVENEHITNNNNKRFFIEVINKQYKVLFYAKSPHPDLGSLKNILGDHFEVETIFNDDEIPDLKDYDILFLHQIPYYGMNNYEYLKEKLGKNKNIPIFYIVGESTDFKLFNDLQNSMQITQSAVKSILDIKPHYNQNFGLFTINNEVIEAANTFPPLSLPHLDFSLSSNHDMLLQMSINDVLTQAPLLSFTTDNEGRKSAYLLGTGIWRWKLYNYYKEKSHDNFEELITKSVKYLLTEKDKEFIINYKENYFNNEPIIFTADLKNPSQELTNVPDLEIKIINRHTKDIYEYNFSKKDKSYYLNINNLPEGIYNFMAKAEHGGKKYLENGNFSVINIGAEAQDLVADAHRMRLLASLTEGKNFSIDELDKIVEALENDESITSIMREETNYKDLINIKSIFFVILSLVTIEWILRKMFGAY